MRQKFLREKPNRHAPNNPFQIDILVAVLIKKFDGTFESKGELDDLFYILERVSEEEGRSFFSTRKADFEHLWGDNREALRLVEIAIRQTPRLFEPRRLHASILLKTGNKIKAFEAIKIMRDMVDSQDPNERRKNYRQYLRSNAEYLVEIGQYKEAKKIYSNRMVFTEAEQNEQVKAIEVIQGYRARNGRSRSRG